MKSKSIFGIIALFLLFQENIFTQAISENLTARNEHINKAEPAYFFVFDASSYTIDDLDGELQQVDASFIRKHFLGTDIALLYHFFETEYTFYSEAAPGTFSDTKSINKPEIYFCINKLNRYYQKAVRKEMLSENLAVLEFKTYLQTAIRLLHVDTQEFQSEAEKAKSPEEIKHLFGKIKFD